MSYFSNQYNEGDKMIGMAVSLFHASFSFKLLLEAVLFDWNINAEKHPHQQGRDSFQCVFGFCLPETKT